MHPTPELAAAREQAALPRARALGSMLFWLARRKTELTCFAIGVALRASMVYRYNPDWSYDSGGHWEVVQWILEHRSVPPVEATFHAFHPPLYYAAAAWLVAHGLSRNEVVWFSVAAGAIRLALIWAGLELYLPRSRLARVAALALAAVLASSVHLDGMNYPEALSGMWLTAALLLVPLALRRPPPLQWRLTLPIGMLLGLAMLTKISGVAVIVAIGAAVLLAVARSGLVWRQRCFSLAAWAAMLAVCLAVCGWYFARNVRDYGRPFVTSFELSTQHFLVEEAEKVPYLDRRSLGFFVCWTRDVYIWPFFPSGLGANARFFPVAVASTFTDYYNYSFAGINPRGRSPMRVNGTRPINKTLLAAAQYAVLGGTVIFAGTVAAFVAAVRRLYRRRDFARISLLFVPCCMLLAAVHFAVFYPVDRYGVIKGVYMQFGAAPLHGLFGVAVAWASQRAWRWPILALFGIAFWLVAAYTVYCRLGLKLIPLV